MTMEITTREPVGVVPMEDQLPGMIALAIEKDLDVEKLERLIALQERVMLRNAEMAMAQALASFQAECPPIPRVRTADVRKNGVKQYEYHFAPLEEIARVIRPFLTKNGLSYTHDAEVSDTHVRVTCTLQHVEGAKRTATFTGPFDNSGGKNPLQAVGSARSYGRRYSLLDVLGLTTEEDDDGKHGGGTGEEPPRITPQQAADIEALADEVGIDKVKFLEIAGVASFADIDPREYPNAVRVIERKRRSL